MIFFRSSENAFLHYIFSKGAYSDLLICRWYSRTIYNVYNSSYCRYTTILYNVVCSEPVIDIKRNEQNGNKKSTQPHHTSRRHPSTPSAAPEPVAPSAPPAPQAPPRPLRRRPQHLRLPRPEATLVHVRREGRASQPPSDPVPGGRQPGAETKTPGQHLFLEVWRSLAGSVLLGVLPDVDGRVDEDDEEGQEDAEEEPDIDELEVGSLREGS